MKQKPLAEWILVNAVGLGVAFMAVLQTKMLIDFGFDWRMHWNWIEKPLAQNATQYLVVLLMMLVGGAILGSAQALILRSRPVPVIGWILATVAGFGVVAAIIDWPLIALGVLGAIPGPVEPIIVTVGGAGFAGVFQYLTLRRRGIHSTKWLVLWLVGLVLSLIPTALVFMSLQGLGLSPSWPVEVFLNGCIAAGVAAWISGKALFAPLDGGQLQSI